VLVVVRCKLGEARDDFRHAFGQRDGHAVDLAGRAPVIQAARQLRGDTAEIALAGFWIAHQGPRRLVPAMYAIGVVDDEHAGFHAPDDQLVDLREVGQIQAALFGQRFGLAHLLAKHEAQRGRGEITEPVQTCFKQVAVFMLDQAPVHTLAEYAERGQSGEEATEARRQQQGAGTDVDEQQHRVPANRLALVVGFVGRLPVDQHAEGAGRRVFPVRFRQLLAVGAQPGEIFHAAMVDYLAAEKRAASQHRILLPDREHAPDEIEQALPALVQVPVDPGDLVILAVGVVVALLRPRQLVAVRDHRDAL